MARPSFDQDLPVSVPPSEPPTPRTRYPSKKGSHQRSKSRKKAGRVTARSIPRTVSARSSWISTETSSDFTQTPSDLLAPPPSAATPSSFSGHPGSSVGPTSSNSGPIYLDVDSSTVAGSRALQRSTSRATNRSESDVSSWYNTNLDTLKLRDTSVWQLDGSEPPLPSVTDSMSRFSLRKAKPVYMRPEQAVPVTPTTRAKLIRGKPTPAAGTRTSFSSMLDPAAFPPRYPSGDMPYDTYTTSSTDEKLRPSKRATPVEAAYYRLQHPRHNEKDRHCFGVYRRGSTKKWLLIDAMVVLIILGLVATAVVLTRVT